jgi:tetratricopeptide (TPR) repeat protein
MEAYLDLPRDKVASNPQAKIDLPAALHSLDVAIGIEPESSTAWWARGKAQQLLGDHEQAYESFHRSYKIDEGKNPDSGVQLLLECLETGRGGEAVQVAETISKAQPDNAGMLANLALAYLINGQVAEAARAASNAEAMDPDDPAIASAKTRVDNVQSGRIPRPNRIAEIAP